MGTVEQELVDDAVHPDCTAHQLQRRIIRVAEDEVVSIKGGQLGPADAACQGGHVVDIWLFDHGCHGLFDATAGKLVVRVLVPDGFEVEIRASHERLQK